VHGLSVSLEVGAAIAAVGALVAATLVRPRADAGTPGAHPADTAPLKRAPMSPTRSSAEAQV
jgi:hypothetical protein